MAPLCTKALPTSHAASSAMASYNASQIGTNPDRRNHRDERRGSESGQPLGGGLERS